MSKNQQSDVDSSCFWCDIAVADIPKQDRTRDHLMPIGMGCKRSGKTVLACRNCNEERGKITELYSDRLHLISYIEKRPERITSYKNKFCKKVKKLSNLILKWELLHRQKEITLPYSLLEIIRLDELMPYLE